MPRGIRYHDRAMMFRRPKEDAGWLGRCSLAGAALVRRLALHLSMLSNNTSRSVSSSIEAAERHRVRWAEEYEDKKVRIAASRHAQQQQERRVAWEDASSSREALETSREKEEAQSKTPAAKGRQLGKGRAVPARVFRGAHLGHEGGSARSVLRAERRIFSQTVRLSLLSIHISSAHPPARELRSHPHLPTPYRPAAV